jgi:hypothetical protein
MISISPRVETLVIYLLLACWLWARVAARGALEVRLMDYVIWTVLVLVAMYIVVRLVFSWLFKKEKYKG